VLAGTGYWPQSGRRRFASILSVRLFFGVRPSARKLQVWGNVSTGDQDALSRLLSCVSLRFQSYADLRTED